MAQLIIVTTPTNSGDGTPLATAFNYCNSNFSELYSRVQTSPPTSLVGVTGDTAGMYAYDETYFYYCFANYDGSSTIWGQVTQVGNISVSAISSGTSNVKISDVNGNATTNINGTSNVVVVSSTGQFITGTVSATGNITGDFILGNGSQLTGLPQSYTNANVAAFLPTYTGNISAGNLSVTTAITTPGSISATGNITTPGFFIGDFIGNIVANITNIPGPGGAVVFNDGAGNAAATAGLVFNNSGPNVLTVDGSYSATGNVIATGNISGGNLSGTAIAGTLSTAAQPNITSVGTLVSVSVTANVTGGNINTGGQVSATGNIRTAGYFFATQDINVGGDVTATSYTGGTMSLSGNIIAGGQLSATGNVIGNSFIGNGSQLTGLITNTIQNGNSNVLISTSAGNISVNVNGVSPVTIFTPLGQAVTGVVSASGNITGGNLTTSGIITATANITGGNLTTAGNVSTTSNVIGGNILTTGTVSTSGQIISASISTTGNILTGNLATLGIISAGNVIGSVLNTETLITNIGDGGVAILNGGSNGVGNIGNASSYFNTVFAKATSAQYADLAENYMADANYVAGTVVIFGGIEEITVTEQAGDERVAGAISTNPAYLMNSGQPGTAVALRGRVPVFVIGPVTKGDSLVTSTEPGYAMSVGRDRSYGQAVFAKALETNIDPGKKTILAVVI